MKSLSGFDQRAYESAIAFISRTTRLYSSSEHAYIVYRFVEKLFCATTGAEDHSARDISFDAKLGEQGFGIKTFVASSPHVTKREKVAEFTRDASNGNLTGLRHESLALRVSELRNARVSSDASEIGVDISKSAYHCLVRLPGFAIVHEEPYRLIDVKNIYPLSVNGAPLDKFENRTEGTVYFSDGINSYQYMTAKNTLSKSFDLASFFVSPHLSTPIDENIWRDVFVDWSLETLPSDNKEAERGVRSETEGAELEPEYIILPLYSTRSGAAKQVPSASGINQWNAAGRERSFGEAYIPIPAEVRRVRPDFFPGRDTKFPLLLPNGKIVSAKTCQADGKALMSAPNINLCQWLFSTIDGTWDAATRRFESRSPYTYQDLTRINKDSVKITRDRVRGCYVLESAPVGSFEDFIENYS